MKSEFESLCDLSRVWCSGVGVVCESANYLKRAERLLTEIPDNATLEKIYMVEHANHLLQASVHDKDMEQRVQDEVADLLSRLLNRIDKNEDHVVKSRCYTYKSAAILRGRSPSIQRAFEEARIALRIHGKSSFTDNVNDSNWAAKVQQCAEALFTCGKMQEHAGNASQASAYYKSGFDMAQRANSAPLRRAFSRALASLSAHRGIEISKELLHDCEMDDESKKVLVDATPANVVIQKRENVEQNIIRGNVCFEWEESSKVPFVCVDEKYLQRALEHYLEALSSLDDLVTFLKRWGTESYGRLVSKMRCELLIRCARVLIRMKEKKEEKEDILKQLREIVSNKSLSVLERLEVKYAISMFEYRSGSKNQARKILENTFEEARRLASPNLCRRLGRFLAYMMLRDRKDGDDDDIISYLLFWSLGSAARQRAFAELRRREEENGGGENKILSQLFVHDWRECTNLRDASLAFHNMVKKIPKEWHVVGVCTPPREMAYWNSENAHIILVRIQSTGKCVVGFGKGNIVDVRNVLLEFQDILSCAEKTTKGVVPISGKEWTKSERKRWWDERYDQDKRMSEMLRSGMQTNLLGHLSILFGSDDDEDDDNDDDFDALCSRFKKLNVASLKTQLKERELSRTGRKADLVTRLASSMSSSSSSKSSTKTFTICIFDEILQRLPWESMPHIRENNLSVSRCPAAAFVFASHIRKLLNSTKKITASFENARTLVNPSGDLKRTQKVMKPVFEKLQREFNWKSISPPGQKPPDGSVREALESSDCELFVYCGHNAGEEFLCSKDALRLRSTPNVMLLAGCSSGRLKDEGVFEPSGTILQYICAGVPCIVANLWDVTDADIDRFLIRVLEEVKRSGKPSDILRAVSISRSACKLQFAVGAAPVCYGVPVWID